MNRGLFSQSNVSIKKKLNTKCLLPWGQTLPRYSIQNPHIFRQNIVLCTPSSPRVVLVALCISRWTSLSLHVPRTHKNAEYALCIFADRCLLRFYRKSPDNNIHFFFTYQSSPELENSSFKIHKCFVNSIVIKSRFMQRLKKWYWRPNIVCQTKN